MSGGVRGGLTRFDSFVYFSHQGKTKVQQNYATIIFSMPLFVKEESGVVDVMPAGTQKYATILTLLLFEEESPQGEVVNFPQNLTSPKIPINKKQ